MSMQGKVMGMMRKALGRSGYEEVAQDEEDPSFSAKRRATETPSAIYAHKTIEASALICLHI